MTMMIQPSKPKKGGAASGRGGLPRFLISVTVLGSAGPIRFVVGDGDPIASVIGTTLKLYAKEGRLPLLRSDLNGFLLYAAHSGSDALSPWVTVGSLGCRNFVMCVKPPVEAEKKGPLQTSKMAGWKSGSNLKAWINKSLSFKISSH